MLAAASALGWPLAPRPGIGLLRHAHARSATPRLQEEFNEADFDFSMFNDALLEEAGRLADLKEAQEAEERAEGSAAGWAALAERLSAPADDSRAPKVAAAQALADGRAVIIAAAADGERRSLEEEDAPYVDEVCTRLNAVLLPSR